MTLCDISTSWHRQGTVVTWQSRQVWSRLPRSLCMCSWSAAQSCTSRPCSPCVTLVCHCERDLCRCLCSRVRVIVCPKCPGVLHLVHVTARSCSVAFECSPGSGTTFLHSDCKSSRYFISFFRRLFSFISALHTLLRLGELLTATTCHMLGLDLETVVRCTEQVCVLQVSSMRRCWGN